MNNKNKGFTLVELIVVIAVFTVLLGILEPSVSSIFGFRAQRAVNSIGAALDKTKTEAMSRLVGEMKLEKREDGYYISYFLDRGKANGVIQDQEEKIAPASTLITIYTTKNATGKEMQTGDEVILTYNREDGSFRPIQIDVMTEGEISDSLEQHKDISFKDMKLNATDGLGTYCYCTKIEVKGGYRVRTLELNQGAGTYTITAG